jgi:hypothetical protein
MDASNVSAPHTSVTEANKASNQDGVRRSVCHSKAPERFRDSGIPVAFTSQVDGEALYYSYQNYGEKDLQRKMQDPIAFVVKLDPDTFHYGIAMKQPDREDFDESFHYRSVIGKLNFLEKSTRPTIHQAA